MDPNDNEDLDETVEADSDFRRVQEIYRDYGFDLPHTVNNVPTLIPLSPGDAYVFGVKTSVADAEGLQIFESIFPLEYHLFLIDVLVANLASQLEVIADRKLRINGIGYHDGAFINAADGIAQSSERLQAAIKRVFSADRKPHET